MAKHTEIESIGDESSRFCLDYVDRSEENDDPAYAFVWRGTQQSAHGFIPRPAYFYFNELGQLLAQFFERPENRPLRDEFYRALFQIQ